MLENKLPVLGDFADFFAPSGTSSKPTAKELLQVRAEMEAEEICKGLREFLLSKACTHCNSLHLRLEVNFALLLRVKDKLVNHEGIPAEIRDGVLVVELN